MKRIWMMLLLVSTMLGSVAGQNGEEYWEQFYGPTGGTITSLVKTGNGKIYGHHWHHKRILYRSSDNGNNWEEITNVSYSTTINFTYFFVGSAGNLFYKSDKWYKSANEGLTWDSIPASADVTLLTESNAGALLGYRPDKKIYRSTDSGQTWTVTLTIPANESIVEELKQTPSGGLTAKIKYSSGNKVFYRSTDDGQNWQRITHPSNYTLLFISPSGVFIFKGTNDWMYRSIDNAQTFDAGFLHTPLDDAIVALPTGRLLMIYNDEFYFSDNGGFNWENLHCVCGNRIDLQLLQSIATPADSSVFCNINGSFCKSTDGGINWAPSNNGIRRGGSAGFKMYGDSLWMMATATGLWQTENAGQDWTKIMATTTEYTVLNYDKTTTGGLVLMNDNKLWYAAPPLDTFIDISPHQLNSWSSYVINPYNDHLFLNVFPGVKRSVDFGQTWDFIPDETLKSMVFHPSGRILALNNFTTHILHSDDQGLTWTATSVPNVPDITGLFLKPDGSLLLSFTENFQGHYMKSTDLGETWVATGGGYDYFGYSGNVQIDANGYLYVTEYGLPKLSVNDGVTWQNLPSYFDVSPYPYINDNLYSLTITSRQKLFVATTYGETYVTVNPVSEGAFIVGQVQRDADADCSTDDAQQPIKNNFIEARNDDITYRTTTDPGGRYVFFVDTGAYDIAAISANNVWWNFCDSLQSVDATELLATDTVDFAAVALSECPLITVNVGVSTMRRCFDNTVYVQYCNRGAEPADSAWIDLFLDSHLDFISSGQPHNILGNNKIRFFLGDVASDDCGAFNLVVNVNCATTVLGQTHCISAHGYPDTLCTDIPTWSGAYIEASVACQDSVVHFELQNTGTAPSQILDYIIIEDDVVMLQGQNQYGQGQSLTLPVTANGHTYRIESEQEPGHPFSTRAIAFEEGCGGFESLGFINQFSVNGLTPSWHRVCRENTGSFDPNDKHGYPVGAGAEHRIRPGQPIEYMIRFQNTGTDTAFTVVVRDTLSAWLNPVSIIPGASSHSYTMQLQDNVASFAFSNILLPDSTTNLAGSQGFVTFSIDQQPDIPLGTQILNDAAIFFDFNEPVITNETLHTIGIDEVVSSAPEQPDLQTAVRVSPNPAGVFTSFQWTKDRFSTCRLQLFDPFGKPVFDKTVTGNTYTLTRNGLPPGAYGWRVSDPRGQLTASGVVVFQ